MLNNSISGPIPKGIPCTCTSFLGTDAFLGVNLNDVFRLPGRRQEHCDDGEEGDDDELQEERHDGEKQRRHDVAHGDGALLDQLDGDADSGRKKVLAFSSVRNISVLAKPFSQKYQDEEDDDQGNYGEDEECEPKVGQLGVGAEVGCEACNSNSNMSRLRELPLMMSASEGG